MTTAQRYMHEYDGITEADVLQDVIHVNRCGLDTTEAAQMTKTVLRTVQRYVAGEVVAPLEWMAMLGRCVADRYRDYRISAWVAVRTLPREMWIERESDK